MRKIIVAIITSFLPVYVCPCGHKAKGRAAAMQHLNSHPASMGAMDYNTGAIVW